VTATTASASPGSAWLRPDRLSRALWFATPLVAALGLAAELAYALAPEVAAPFTYKLSLSYEANVPTWYISALLLLCSLALVECGAAARRRGERYARHWLYLAGVFALMSLDETAQFHEHLYLLVDGSGIFYFSWVIPGAAIAALVALAFLRFWLALPEPTRRRFAIAGAIYLTGALVMELPLGYWTERAGSDNLVYGLIDFVEETLELTGASLFLVALARHRAAWESAA
jgi:hypothetical protein